MVRKRDSFWDYAEDLKNGRFLCKFCQKDFAGGISRIKSHLSGIRGRDVEICLQVPVEVQLAVVQAIDTPSKKAKIVAASNNTWEGESISTSSSAQMPNIREEKDKSIVDRKFAKLLISDSICLDAIQSPFFNDFVKGVAEYGPGYELPSSLTLKSLIMPGIKKEVEEYIHNVKIYLVKTGCTLMYNIWPSRKSCIKRIFRYKNIFAYTPRGLACMDPSEDRMEEFCLFEKAMSSIVEEIGPRHVVQFIINNDSDDSSEIGSTKDMLKKYPWIYMTNCATHGIGLLLEEIYHISFVYYTVNVAKLIVTYIYKHNVDVPLRRAHKRREDDISFEICMLISLLEVGDVLQALQVSIITLSTNWRRTPNYKQV